MAGPVPETEKWELYRNAHALVATSVYEGFGMPLLEALAAGLPVAATRMGGVAGEVIGETAGLAAAATPAAVG